MRTFLLTACLAGIAGGALSQTNRQNVLDATGSTNTIWALQRASAHTWIAAGNSGTLLRYHDSSKNWLAVTGVAGAADYRSISFPDSTTGYVSGIGNALIKTTNGGTTWASLATGLTGTTISITTVCFRTATTGFIGGSAIGGTGATGRFIRKTADGGGTWTTVTPAGLSSTPYAMGFFTGTTGISAGVSGTIYRTTDGGTTWAPVTSGTTSSLYSLAVADSNTAVLCGTGGTILRTTNRGASWTAVASGTTATLQSAQFAGAQHGMIAGLNGTLLRTADGGLTWSLYAVPTTKNLYGVSLQDPAHAVVVGAAGTALAIDTAQTFHRLFDEDFKNPTAPLAYFGYTSTDLTSAGTRTWSFVNRNEANNGLLAAQWFPGAFAIYDAAYYEDSLGQQQRDSAYIETRTLDFSAAAQLTLRWNEAFYTHPDGRSHTRIQGFNGTAWIDLYGSSGMEFGDGVYSAVFPNTKRSIDISALAGVANAKLRFRYNADNTGDSLKQYWAVGDVEVTTQATALSVTGIQTTPGIDAACRYSVPQKLQVRVANTGEVPVFPLEFGWKVGMQEGVGADYSTLQPGATAWYTVADSVVIPPGGVVALRGWLRKMPNAVPADDSFILSVADNPVTPRYLGPDTVLCTGGTLTLSAPAGLVNGLQWSTGDTAHTLTVQQPGTYFFTAPWRVCTTGDTIVVLPGIGIPQLQLIGATLSATPGALTYRWFRNGTAVAGAATATLSLSGSGTYTVTVTGPGGCSATSAPFEYVPASVGRAAAGGALRVYPSPARQAVQVDGLRGSVRLHLSDPAGRVLRQVSLDGLADRVSLPVEDLPAGVYFLQVTGSDGRSATSRFLKAD